ncbi:MAG: alpha/beta hydrolase, partial [Hyphomicrobiaceae bacterium]|nr:alpha/beta hydrolase [Hyphomicrobiaceae bacterium]
SGRVTLGRATLHPARPSAETGRPSPDTSRATVSAIALAEQDFATVAVRQLVVATRHPDQVLVFVHGYDTGFDDAVRQGARFAAELGFDGAVVIYSWPSVDDPRGYRRDASRANDAAPHLAATLRLLADSTSAKAVHVAAAGLGARAAVGAIRRFIDTPPVPLGDARATARLKLGELLLIAPDMDRADLAEAAFAIAPSLSGITLYASANDRALAVTRRDAGLVPRAGDVVESGPLTTPAVVTVDVTPQPGDPAAAGTDIVADKSSAGEPGPLIIHARAVLSGGVSRDPSVAGLRRVETTSGAYWVSP